MSLEERAMPMLNRTPRKRVLTLAGYTIGDRWLAVGSSKQERDRATTKNIRAGPAAVRHFPVMIE